MFTDFKNCFTNKLNNESVVKWLLNSQPHLNNVATLPCDLLLITMHASNFRYFSDIDVSQGSSATRLRCGGIVNEVMLHIYYWICHWKNFENRSIFWRSYGQYYGGLFFDSQCKVQFFGRPFVKRFALCYRTVVTVLSCLSVRDVGTLWPNGWRIKMKLGVR